MTPDSLYDYVKLPDGSWKCSLKPHVRIFISALQAAKNTGKKVDEVLREWEFLGIITLEGGECLEQKHE